MPIITSSREYSTISWPHSSLRKSLGIKNFIFPGGRKCHHRNDRINHPTGGNSSGSRHKHTRSTKLQQILLILHDFEQAKFTDSYNACRVVIKIITKHIVPDIRNPSYRSEVFSGLHLSYGEWSDEENSVRQRPFAVLGWRRLRHLSSCGMTALLLL